MTDPTLVVEPDPGRLAGTIAARLLTRLAEIQATGRTPSVALTGGTIADAIHREIGRRAADSDVDWHDVDVYWGDERFVPPDDPDRNALQAKTAFLDAVGTDPARVHEMPAAGGELDLDAAAAAYSETVRSHGTGRFDVLMLGIGPDGHVASLFPGFSQLDVDDRIAVGVTDSPKPPPERITLTFGALNRSGAVWFVVSGDAKADAVSRALGGADLHQVPATGVRGEDETVWFLDEPAASRLPG